MVATLSLAGSGRAADARSVSDLFRLAVVLSGGDQLAKPNFEYQKRQKELEKKKKKEEKLLRKQEKKNVQPGDDPDQIPEPQVPVQGETT